jgi:hypothetical protein
VIDDLDRGQGRGTVEGGVRHRERAVAGSAGSLVEGDGAGVVDAVRARGEHLDGAVPGVELRASADGELTAIASAWRRRSSATPAMKPPAVSRLTDCSRHAVRRFRTTTVLAYASATMTPGSVTTRFSGVSGVVVERREGVDDGSAVVRWFPAAAAAPAVDRHVASATAAAARRASRPARAVAAQRWRVMSLCRLRGAPRPKRAYRTPSPRHHDGRKDAPRHAARRDRILDLRDVGFRDVGGDLKATEVGEDGEPAGAENLVTRPHQRFW